MRPIDFVVFADGCCPNIPAPLVAEAMMKEIVILGAEGEYEILSYYMSNGIEGGCMFLDIQRKSK